MEDVVPELGPRSIWQTGSAQKRLDAADDDDDEAEVALVIGGGAGCFVSKQSPLDIPAQKPAATGDRFVWQAFLLFRLIGLRLGGNGFGATAEFLMVAFDARLTRDDEVDDDVEDPWLEWFCVI